MLLKRKIPVLFVIAVGLLNYGFLDWNISYFFSVFKRSSMEANAILSNTSVSLNNLSVYQSSLTSAKNTIRENGDNIIQEEQKLKENVDIPNEYLILNDNSSKDSSRQESQIVKEIDKEAEVRKAISGIAKLANIKENSRVMGDVHGALLRLPRPPPISADLVEKNVGSLLSTVVPPVARVTYTETWHGLRLPLITCAAMGRLGNVLGEYATLYAVHRLYNVSVVTLDVMRARLKDFPYLSLPKIPAPYNKEGWKGVKNFGSLYNYAPVELAAAGLFGPLRFVMREYAFEIQLFHTFKKELKKEFTFSSFITEEVQRFLKSVADTRLREGVLDPVFVGFHVRRTDYVKHIENFGGTLPEDAYYNHAMNYYRTKFPGRVVFIAASDNLIFIKSKLGNNPDVFFSPGISPTYDMALLSSCNHSIVTLGSYGFWTGFLAGGEVVYPDAQFNKEYRFSRAMYERIGLSSFTPLPVD